MSRLTVQFFVVALGFFAVSPVDAEDASGTVVSVQVVGTVEMKNVFRNTDVKGGTVVRQQVFLVVRPAEKNGAPVIVEMKEGSVEREEVVRVGDQVAIAGVRRRYTSVEIDDLERRAKEDLLAQGETHTLSTTYRVISLLWRTGAVQVGSRPIEVSWVQENGIRQLPGK